MAVLITQGTRWSKGATFFTRFKKLAKYKIYMHIWSLYLVLALSLAFWHEPWADEAQAWLIARDSSMSDLLFRVIRYEGSPALWHLLLMIPAKIGMPFEIINIFSVLIASTGIFALLKNAPFHPVIKILLPFTFFLFFQYSVIARSYVLVPVLLFVLASFYRSWPRKILKFILLIGFLANVSAHAAILSVAIFMHCFADIIKKWTELNDTDKRKYIFAACTYIILLALALVQMYPADDCYFARGIKPDMRTFVASSVRIMSDALISNYALDGFKINSYIDCIRYVFITFVFVVFAVWFLWRKVLLLYSVPTFGLLILFHFKYYNVWHQGILFVFFIFVLWISIDKETEFSLYQFTKQQSCFNYSPFKNRLLPQMMNILLGIICVTQIYWSANVLLYDINNPYSGSKKAARFLKANGYNSYEITGLEFKSIAIQPYFTNNIFGNINPGSNKGFWWWSYNNGYDMDIESILDDKPDVIIDSIITRRENPPRIIEGYNVVENCPGGLYWKTGIVEKEHFVIYLRIYK